MNDDLERRLRDLVRPVDLPPAPPALRERLSELEGRPARSRRRATWKSLLILVPVAAALVLGLSALIGGGPRPSVTPPPLVTSSPLPSGGISQAQAIELSRSHLAPREEFEAAWVGTYRDLAPPGTGFATAGEANSTRMGSRVHGRHDDLQSRRRLLFPATGDIHRVSRLLQRGVRQQRRVLAESRPVSRADARLQGNAIAIALRPVRCRRGGKRRDVPGRRTLGDPGPDADDLDRRRGNVAAESDP